MSTPISTQDIKQSVLQLLLGDTASPFDEKRVRAGVDEYFALQFDRSHLSYSVAQLRDHVYGFMVATAVEHAGRSFYYGKLDELSCFFISDNSHAIEMRAMQQLDNFLADRLDALLTHGLSIRSYHAQVPRSSGRSLPILLTASLNPYTDASGTGKTLEALCTTSFLSSKPPHVRELYKSIVFDAVRSLTPVDHIRRVDPSTLSIQMAFRPDRPCYLRALTTLISSIAGAVVVKKFCESFSNKQQVYTFYVRNVTAEQLERKALLMGMLPHTPGRVTTSLFNTSRINAEEVIYCHAVTMYAFHFAPPTASQDFDAVERTLAGSLQGRLQRMRMDLFQTSLTEEVIGGIIAANLPLVKQLFADFAAGRGATDADHVALRKLIESQKDRPYGLDGKVLRTFIDFNENVLRTNFFRHQKAAVSFKLDPRCVIARGFERRPFAVVMVLGSQFRGFHVRFADIARGGIRMVVSASQNEYLVNKHKLLPENYNLASAQLLKNKDIPEGGCKGTILVSPRSRMLYSNHPGATNTTTLFLQYVDALLDLVVVNVSGVRPPTAEEDMLFLGPDENTAGEFPSLAAQHARRRGYTRWRSFTTGKGTTDGGIAHDTYGMTSIGVRTYLEELYQRLGLEQEALTKVQTGGPDGDLGSNEILLSRERYIGLVDGSGTIYDPLGVNRDELVRLAKGRTMLRHFERSKLSPNGFFVDVKEKERRLPDGTVVDGLTLRNTFHVSRYCVADVFVPCGGRPESVTIESAPKMLLHPEGVTGQQMLDGAVGSMVGKLRFRFVVEGANLFFTNNARIALERVGLVLVKDSSANKGGVGCSSLEVLAALALDHAKFSQMMCFTGTPPPFYAAYVEAIQAKIRHNAQREFHCLWRERRLALAALPLSKAPTLTEVSDKLSLLVLRLRTFLSGSEDIVANTALERYVLDRYAPEVLLKEVPMDDFIARVPAKYRREIVSMWIASEYAYTVPLAEAHSPFAFFAFMQKLLKGVSASRL